MSTALWVGLVILGFGFGPLAWLFWAVLFGGLAWSEAYHRMVTGDWSFRRDNAKNSKYVETEATATAKAIMERPTAEGP